jgi:hypothetical protein
MRNHFLIPALILLCSFAANAQQYKISTRIPFPGEGGWDYLLAESSNRQLYVSHGTQVEVVDLDSEKPVAADARYLLLRNLDRSSPGVLR